MSKKMDTKKHKSGIAISVLPHPQLANVYCSYLLVSGPEISGKVAYSVGIFKIRVNDRQGFAQ